jgi:TBC1 domain family member 5
MSSNTSEMGKSLFYSNINNNDDSGHSASNTKPLKLHQVTAQTIKSVSKINVSQLSFDEKFDLLFNNEDNGINFLKTFSIQGHLSNSNLRSISWMIFLNIISIDQSKWVDEMKINRERFEILKNKVYLDPNRHYRIDENTDDNNHSDHPLSNIKHSIWNKYFEQNDVKAMINQDVTRINQHSPYFGLQSTQDSIVNLLLIYVESTKNEYKQGMHEILTCIMFVLHEEYTAHISRTIEPKNEPLDYLKDLKYLEHDVFNIFYEVMNNMYGWFGSKSDIDTFLVQKESKRRASVFNLTPTLYKYDDSLELNDNLITSKINKITHVILKNNDFEVYNHMLEIDVSLHLFGLRWLRLLFLRELDFPSVLVLWDAIFAADPCGLDLVDFIFVSLLICLREKILSMDNSECMRLLMQPQYHLDPNEVLKTALYLQNPEVKMKIKS